MRGYFTLDRKYSACNLLFHYVSYKSIEDGKCPLLHPIGCTNPLLMLCLYIMSWRGDMHPLEDYMLTVTSSTTWLLQNSFERGDAPLGR